MAFESQYYKSLDLERAARDQWGPTATLTWTGDDLYAWKAKVGSDLKSLDLKQAVAQQYGSDYALTLVGVHRYDWRAVRASDLDYWVLPVMLIASDHLFDIAGVRSGLTHFMSVLAYIREWYGQQVSATFRELQPLVVTTDLTSSDWNGISNSTAQPDHRYDLFNDAKQAYPSDQPQPGDKLKVALALYTGDSPDVWLGAASGGNMVVVPPRATSITCPASPPIDYRCSDAAYAIGHELGHTFGLHHSCDVYPGFPNCQQSIMQTGKPPQAILLQPEVCILLQSPFFFSVYGIVVVPHLGVVPPCVLGPEGPA